MTSTAVLRLWKTMACALAVVLGGCDYMQYSPYEAKVDDDDRDTTARHLAALAATGQAGFAPFTFAVISDTHTTYDELQSGVSALNEDPDLAFVLVAGDITDLGILREFEWSHDLLGRLRIPYLTVVGAHDAIINGKRIYQSMFGPFDYSFVYNNVKFVLLNTNSWEFDNQVPDFAWLERELVDRALYRYVVVMSHQAPFDERFDDATEARFRQLLTDYDVTLALHGHTHTYTDYGVPPGGGVHYVVVGSIDNYGYVRANAGPTSIDIERVEIQAR